MTTTAYMYLRIESDKGAAQTNQIECLLPSRTVPVGHFPEMYILRNIHFQKGHGWEGAEVTGNVITGMDLKRKRVVERGGWQVVCQANEEVA